MPHLKLVTLLSPHAHLLLTTFLEGTKPSAEITRDMRHCLIWAAENAETWPGNPFDRLGRNSNEPGAREKSFVGYFRPLYADILRQADVIARAGPAIRMADQFMKSCDLRASELLPDRAPVIITPPQRPDIRLAAPAGPQPGQKVA